MPDRRVLERHTARAPDGPRLARDVDRGPDVAHLADAHLDRREPSGLLQPAEVQREQLRLVEGGCHQGELALGELERPDRLAEMLAGPRVFHRALQAGTGRAGYSPQDAEPRLGQARQRAL